MRAFRGGLPLVVVFGIAAALLAIATVARVISARAGFLVERETVLIVWLIGLLVAAALIAWVSRAAFRRASSPLNLWLMALTAVALASPLLMIFAQHPSP